MIDSVRREQTPEGFAEMVSCETQVDSDDQLRDETANFDQAQAQGLQGQPLGSCGDLPQAQRVRQRRRGMQEQPHVVCQEAVTGETVDNAGAFEIHDPDRPGSRRLRPAIAGVAGPRRATGAANASGTVAA